jgi:hypothetical protein
MAAESIQKKRIAAQELAPKRLAVAIPQIFSRQNPLECPTRQLPKNYGQPIVEPYECVRPAPNNVTHLAIVAIRYPGIGAQGLNNALSKNIEWSLCPVGSPVQCIQFNVRISQPLRQLTRNGRFAGTRRADHNDALTNVCHGW